MLQFLLHTDAHEIWFNTFCATLCSSGHYESNSTHHFQPGNFLALALTNGRPNFPSEFLYLASCSIALTWSSTLGRSFSTMLWNLHITSTLLCCPLSGDWYFGSRTYPAACMSLCSISQRFSQIACTCVYFWAETLIPGQYSEVPSLRASSSCPQLNIAT